MQDSLQAIKDQVEAGDVEAARTLADEYVSDNPSLFTDMQTKNVEELVTAIDVFRAAAMEDNQWQVEAWLLHHYEPQNIGGPADATVRVVSQ